MQVSHTAPTWFGLWLFCPALVSISRNTQSWFIILLYSAVSNFVITKTVLPLHFLLFFFVHWRTDLCWGTFREKRESHRRQQCWTQLLEMAGTKTREFTELDWIKYLQCQFSSCWRICEIILKLWIWSFFS